MRALVKQPKQPAQVRVLPDDVGENLAAMQSIVGGWIEQVPLSDRLVAIVDEDGQRKGLKRNVFGLAGTVVFVGLGEDEYTDVPNDDPLLLEVI